MKNKLTDLTNHLYAQIERLSDENLSSEQLQQECYRAEAVSKLSGNIISIANTSLNALKLVANGVLDRRDLPQLLNSSDVPNGG